VLLADTESMAEQEDSEACAYLNVTAAHDAYVAGSGWNAHLAPSMEQQDAERQDEDGRRPNFGKVPGLQVGSGNFQVNNFNVTTGFRA
jgi:hypothetical protein